MAFFKKKQTCEIFQILLIDMEIRAVEHSELSDFFDRQFNSYSLLKKHKTSNYKTWAFAAYVNNKLVAAIKGEIFWSVAHIDLLIVDSKYRNQGIGTELYKKVS
jgi:GNAT superfamily N-acetyltransferase